MANYSLPIIGEIEPDNLEPFYYFNVPYKGQNIRFNLEFEKKSVDEKHLDVVKYILENLEEFDSKNKLYIQHDYDNPNGETVRSYIEHHIEECAPDEISKLINLENTSQSREVQLMNSLKLVHVSISPESEELFATCDYSIGEEITQYLVVIYLDRDGALNSMSTES